MPGRWTSPADSGLGCDVGVDVAVVAAAAAVARRSDFSEEICSSMDSRRAIRAAVASPGTAVFGYLRK